MSGETEANESGWTVDTLRADILARMSLLEQLLKERYEMQREASTIAFNAQQTAMTTALTAAERAVQAALLSAEKAVGKAEVAAEKRFDAVNEFRAQLADQAATFMPRSEAETIAAAASARIRELSDALPQTISRVEVDAQRQRDQERITELATRVTKAESAAASALAGRAQIIAVLSIVCAVIVATVVVANFLSG